MACPYAPMPLLCTPFFQTATVSVIRSNIQFLCKIAQEAKRKVESPHQPSNVSLLKLYDDLGKDPQICGAKRPLTLASCIV